MADDEEFLGELIDGRYRLTRRIGRGGYSVVYEADEETRGRFVSRVAVKIFAPQDERDGGGDAMLAEVRALASLAHDHIIGYRAAGDVTEGPLAGRVFLATELGETSLADAVRGASQVAEDKLLDMAEGIAAALAHVHARGAVHRDVKPANILRVERRWKLADFGLVQSVSAGRPSAVAEGTPYYLAPEVLEGTWGPPCDIWSFGVTLLECLTGEFAHTGATREEFYRNLRELPPRVPDDLPPPWSGLIARCLVRDPAQRGTADTLLEAIRRFRRPPAETAPGFGGAASAMTWTVAADGTGDVRTLADALAQASAGAVVEVRPGRYRERLVLHTAITIRGTGRREAVILEAEDAHGLEVRAAGVVVRGITIRSTATAADSACVAVDVADGDLLLDDCEVESEGLAGLAVHGASASAVVRHSRVRGSGDGGVFVYDGASVRLEDADVCDHARAGLVVGEHARAAALRSRLSRNGGSGVHLFADGTATLDDCDLTGNTNMGIAVDGDGHARLTQCRLQQNGLHAVFCRDPARVDVQQCDLSGNACGEWQVGLEPATVPNE